MTQSMTDLKVQPWKWASQKKKKLWKKKFNEEYPKAGAMYRGEHPKGKLSRLSEIEKMKLAGSPLSPYILDCVWISKINSQKSCDVKVYIWLDKFDINKRMHCQSGTNPTKPTSQLKGKI